MRSLHFRRRKSLAWKDANLAGRSSWRTWCSCITSCRKEGSKPDAPWQEIETPFGLGVVVVFGGHPYLENSEWRVSAFCRNYTNFRRFHQKPPFPSKSAFGTPASNRVRQKTPLYRQKNAFVSGKNASARVLHTSQNQNSGKLRPGKNMMTFPAKAVSHEKAAKSDLKRSRYSTV